MGMIAAARPGPGVDRGGPRRAVARLVGKADERLAQPLVARPAEADAVLLPRAVGDGRDARFRREVRLTREAGAVVPELGEDLRRVDPPGPRERHDERPV